MAGGQEVLDRVIVKILGEPLSLTFLGRLKLGDKPLTLTRESVDHLLSSLEQQREQAERCPEPCQIGDLDRDERSAIVPRARARVGNRLHHVGDDGRAGDRHGQLWPTAESRGHHREEEDQPELGVAAARRVAEHAREGDVEREQRDLALFTEPACKHERRARVGREETENDDEN